MLLYYHIDNWKVTENYRKAVRGLEVDTESYAQ